MIIVSFSSSFKRAFKKRISGKDYSLVLNDVYRVQSIDVPTSEAIANLKERLFMCGYEQWLEEG
ncbi:hypothetical protein FJR41_006235 [Dolichospermum planctonicum UHCC 0167]|uniref:hypothetical protein n=1 Tax=Dolichospermum planctonicum TaxID=136072 RepID=UPI0020C1ECFF|nr:hypothetical protein [Dolichospermum planctonicum]MCW9680407.1 hypothetical protein [Dolichospermum planctonicum UHCC 0167]